MIEQHTEGVIPSKALVERSGALETIERKNLGAIYSLQPSKRKPHTKQDGIVLDYH
jgi:hypothetical protein